ncbi:DUF1116 domain-containing protein [Afipia sp. DC4300-2b1]
MRDVFGPVLAKAIRARGGIDLKSIIARGLSMGDEIASAIAPAQACF